MPAVLTNKHCPSCKGKHTLCYEPDVMLDDKREYTFTCPVTQGVVTFVAGFVQPHAIDCPDGAVKLYDA